MAKEWVLNIATNRWQFNRPRYVGKVSEEIRRCQPKKLEDWISYYREKVQPEKFLEMKRYLKDLTVEGYLNWIGEELYKKIHEVMRKEIEDITEEDCRRYIKELVFNRTFEGYRTEIDTIYGQLENTLGVKIHAAPDDWDRKYSIDFYIKARNGYIGLQIKPITYSQTPEIHNWVNWLRESHRRFEREVGGRAFVVFSLKRENRKEIFNREVVDEIRKALRDLGGVP